MTTSSNNQKGLSKKYENSPWKWIPSLYFAEGLPYVVVMIVSVIMYKRLGVSNSDITLYTSLLYLPWVIKPFWSPLVELFKTKRYWIVVMQLVIGAGLAGVAFTLPLSSFFQYSLAFLWLLAFSSATHDIAADGFYMLALDEGDQSFFVGIRSTFYRLAMLTGQGLLVILAGNIEENTGKEPVFFNVKVIENKELIIPALPHIDTLAGKGFMHSDTISIALMPVEKTIVDSIVGEIKKHHLKNSFYQKDEVKSNDEKDESIWTKYVSKPLSSFLTRYFAPEKQNPLSKKTGNIGIAWIKLNEKPIAGEEIVLNINKNGGANDISIIEGTRLVFNENNWNKAAYVVFKTDLNLRKPVSTVFVGRSGNNKMAWGITFFVIAAFFAVFYIYHRLILPKPPTDKPVRSDKDKSFGAEFWQTIASFFRKKQIGVVLAFLLLYRLGESQLLKLASPFLLDSTGEGGLAITTGQLGLYYGTFGIIALTLGGIAGGVLVSRNGLKHWLWWMVAAINLPNLVYVYLSYTMSANPGLIATAVVLEQFGYGFGFTAYMMYCIYIADGPNKTAHFAIATGIMALGMMIPGMLSGWLQEIIGYQHFFVWVMICTIPGFVVTAFLKIEPNFGKKKKVT